MSANLSLQLMWGDLERRCCCPSRRGFDDHDPVLSSAELLQMKSLPDSLVVIGAGYIGIELPTMLAKLGTDVTVVEMLDEVLPNYENDVQRTVRSRAENLGIEFHFGEGATGWEASGEGVTVTTETSSVWTYPPGCPPIGGHPAADPSLPVRHYDHTHSAQLDSDLTASAGWPKLPFRSSAIRIRWRAERVIP